jgi:hypothetical protein
MNLLKPETNIQMDYIQALPPDFPTEGDTQIPARPPKAMFRLHVPFDSNLVLGLLDALPHVS